jgi:hypothetical protein
MLVIFVITVGLLYVALFQVLPVVVQMAVSLIGPSFLPLMSSLKAGMAYVLFGAAFLTAALGCATFLAGKIVIPVFEEWHEQLRHRGR